MFTRCDFDSLRIVAENEQLVSRGMLSIVRTGGITDIPAAVPLLAPGFSEQERLAGS
jgi:hypothetical protein